MVYNHIAPCPDALFDVKLRLGVLVVRQGHSRASGAKLQWKSVEPSREGGRAPADAGRGEGGGGGGGIS